MEIKITTRQVLLVLQILSWIIFVGVSIEAGGYLFNIVYTSVYRPEVAAHFWGGIDLSAVFAYDKGQFIVITSIMALVALLKATLMYQIVAMLAANRLDMDQPFTNALRKFIALMAYMALAIGFFSNYGANYRQWLLEKQIAMPELQQMNLGGGDVWFFMAVILFVIAQIVKRGIEIQNENNLTI